LCKSNQAEPLYLQALEVRRSQLGQDHPDTASSLWNLAALYCNINRLAEAKPLITQAVSILEQTLGNQHPDALNSRQWWQAIHDLP